VELLLDRVSCLHQQQPHGFTTHRRFGVYDHSQALLYMQPCISWSWLGLSPSVGLACSFVGLYCLVLGYNHFYWLTYLIINNAFGVPCFALGFISLPVLNKIQSGSILPPIIQEICSKTM